MLAVLPVSPVLAEESPILVDIQPPQIDIVQPLDGETLSTDRPWVEVHVTDHDSGINQDGIILSIDGIDVTANAIIERMDLQDIGVAKMWQVR